MQRPARIAAACALAALGAAMAASAPLGRAAAQDKPRQCFRAQDWQGSSAAGPRDLYVRVGIRDVWHIGLAQDCPGARFPGPVRITDVVSGSNEICAAADLQIRVAPQGFSNAVACIVSEIDKLTPEQIKALPRKAVP
jgi:Family of unknown function (DUF6491)